MVWIFHKPNFLLSLKFTKEEGFLLQAFQDKKPISIRQAIQKVAKVKTHPVFDQYDSSICAVSPRDIIQVRDNLQNFQDRLQYKAVHIQIDPQIVQLNLVHHIPQEFEFHFDVDMSMELFRCIWPVETEGWRDGWFTWKEQLFQISKWRKEFDPWIFTSLSVQDIPYFVESVLPEMLGRGLPIRSEITLESKPPLYIDIQEVMPDRVCLQIDWNCRQPVTIKGKERYVIADNVLYYGADLDDMKQFLMAGKRIGAHQYAIENDHIPAFHEKILKEWSLLITGNSEQLSVQHPIIQDAELVLYIAPKLSHGIGEAYAFPVLSCGGVMMSIEEVKDRLRYDGHYIAMPKRWLPAAALHRLGFSELQSVPDKGYKILPTEIIHRKVNRIQGPWTRIQLDDVILSPSVPPLQQHLQYLLRWGIPGGASGGTESWSNPLQQLLKGLTIAHPHICVLIVAKRNMLIQLKEQWNELDQVIWINDPAKVPHQGRIGSNIIALSPNILSKSEWIQGERFDLLVMLEPDDMTKSKETLVFRVLSQLNVRMRMGFYSAENYIAAPQVLQTQADLLRLDNTNLFNRTVFNPKMPSSLAQKNVSVRAEQIFEEKPKDSKEALDFIEQARKQANEICPVASYVPFSSRWPMYSRMTPEQLQWYFFWRGEVRKDRYLQTDFSYVVLYLYELINGIGWIDPKEGQQLLRRVWRAYYVNMRELNGLVIQWEADFARFHQLSIDWNEYVQRCPSDIPDEVMDKEFYHLFQTEPLQLSIHHLSILLLERIDRTRFFKENGKADCETNLPKVLALVGAYARTKHGVSLLDMFPKGPARIINRPYFQGAIMDPVKYKDELQAEEYSVLNNQKLRRFITEIVMHSVSMMEAIRKSKKNPPKSQLDDMELETLINRLLKRELTSEFKEQKKVEINPEKLSSLEQDTKKVQRMLTVSQDTEDSSLGDFLAKRSGKGRSQIVRSKTNSSASIDKTGGNLSWNTKGLGDEWGQLGSRFTSTHLEVIRALLEQRPQLVPSIAAANGTMPDLLIDEINQAALDTVGDLLIDGETLLHEYLSKFEQGRLIEKKEIQG